MAFQRFAKVDYESGDAVLYLFAPCAAFGADVTEDWEIHGQATGIEQYHPAFRSAYRGPNSLDPGSRGNETVNLTAYAGARPWDGGEAWADPEMDLTIASQKETSTPTD